MNTYLVGHHGWFAPHWRAVSAIQLRPWSWLQLRQTKAYTIEEVLSAFSGPVDLVHMDIQGAEYDAISPALSLLRQRVKSMMIGTHISLEMHKQLAEIFRQHGWTEVLNFDRSGRFATEFGEIEFGDGFLLYDNPTLS